MPERWPLLMSLPEVCRYLTQTRRQVRSLIEAGRLPQSIAALPGAPRWNRNTLDRAVERIEQRKTTIDYEQERLDLRQAIANFQPPQVRGRSEGAPVRKKKAVQP